MNVGPSSSRFCVGAAAFALSGLLVCSAQAADRQRGRYIEFSEPRSDEVTTNLHQLTTKKDGLKQLEEDLYAPFQSFAPKSSLEGVVAPPPRPAAPSAIQSKRIKELLERRKNWSLMTPEDLLAAPTVDQILKTPEFSHDGQEKKELTTLDRYYQRLLTKRPAKTKPDQADNDDLFSPLKKATSPDAAPARDDADLPKGVKESAQALTAFFESGDNVSPFGSRAMQSSLSDPFGLGIKPPSRDQMDEHKKLMDEYHSVIDPSWHPVAAANEVVPSLVPPGVAPSTPKPSPGLPATPKPASHNALEMQMDIVSPVLGPPGLPDVNAQAVGLTRPIAAPLRVETPKVATPSFTPPKRSF